jgi:hypothetical protein
MSDDFSQPFAFLDRLPALAQQGAVAGLDGAAGGVQDALLDVARSKIAGQTKATFAGLVVYVTGAGVDGSALFSAAVEAVRDRNPAHVSVEAISLEGGPNDIHVVATVPTDYQILLENGVAGDKGFLGELDGQAATLQDAAARGIEEMLR